MFLFGGVRARESTEKATCMHEQQDRAGGVEERGVERLKARRSALKEQERVIVSQRRWRGGERRGKTEGSTICLERTREGHRQPEQWNRFKGSGGERSERRGGRGGSAYGLFRADRYLLELTKLVMSGTVVKRKKRRKKEGKKEKIQNKERIKMKPERRQKERIKKKTERRQQE